MSNEERAERAYRVLLAYQQRHGETSDYEELVTDFLSDLFHLMPQYGIDRETVLRSAMNHYAAEVGCKRRNRVVPVLGSVYCECPICDPEE